MLGTDIPDSRRLKVAVRPIAPSDWTWTAKLAHTLTRRSLQTGRVRKETMNEAGLLSLSGDAYVD